MSFPTTTLSTSALDENTDTPPRDVFFQLAQNMNGVVNARNNDYTSQNSLHIPSSLALHRALVRRDISTNGRIALPDGGMYASTAPINGAMQIELPTLAQANMLGWEVTVYEYTINKITKFLIGGHNWVSPAPMTWVNVAAKCLGNDAYNVRFGHNNSKDCVWIGETTDTWQYPQVSITNVFAGFNANIDLYATGWNISFVSTFGTVQHTKRVNDWVAVWSGNSTGVTNAWGPGHFRVSADIGGGKMAEITVGSASPSGVQQVVFGGDSTTADYRNLFVLKYDTAATLFDVIGQAPSGSGGSRVITKIDKWE